MLNKQELENLAFLAKLKIPEEKFDGLLNDMKEVVEFANKIALANLTDEVFLGFDGLENKFRTDEIIDSFDRLEILKNCKTADEGFFRLSLNSVVGGQEIDS